MKVLVIETAFLGDAVLSLSLAEALKATDPTCSISYLVRPESKALLEFAPAVDAVVAYDKYGSESGVQAIAQKAEELNREQFDAVFVLHESRRTGMLLEKLSAPRKIGYGSFASLTDKIIAPVALQRTERAAMLSKALFPIANAKALPKLDVKQVSIPEVVKGIKRYVAIAPGSVWQTKRWPAERFAEAAQEYTRQGYAVVFIGSPQDRRAMDEVLRSLTILCIDLVGKTTIAEAAAVISQAAFLVANDSAPVHIATSVGTPVVVVFGPTVRQFGFAPPESLGVVVERSLWCRPCTSHGSDTCPIHTHECMTAIPAADVVSASQKLAEFNIR